MDVNFIFHDTRFREQVREETRRTLRNELPGQLREEISYFVRHDHRIQQILADARAQATLAAEQAVQNVTSDRIYLNTVFGTTKQHMKRDYRLELAKTRKEMKSTQQLHTWGILTALSMGAISLFRSFRQD